MSRKAPTSPPASEAVVSAGSTARDCASSRRQPNTPDTPAATRPMALEICAVTGGNPRATSTGKVTRVPEPTTVLIVPAQNPASRMTATCHSSRPRKSTQYS